MNNTYDINSILNAVEEINNKKKNKNISTISIDINKIQKHTTTNDGVLLSTEKLISEAEEHSRKIKDIPLILSSTLENVLILDKEYKGQDLEINNLEEIKLNIIDDLYSSMSKKVKKNTLKIIFDLRQRINTLEKEIEVFNIKKKNVDYHRNDNNSDLIDTEEHLINEEHQINDDISLTDEKHLVVGNDGDLSEDTIKTLINQNSIIKNFEKNEEKLLLKIVDLEQDISLLGKKKINTTFSPILAKTVNQTDQSISKTESELIFFRENYERLIIDNDGLKKKITNSVARIVIIKKNIKELEFAFENLNSILSKNSITKLNEQPLKITGDIDRKKPNTPKTKFSFVTNSDEA